MLDQLFKGIFDSSIQSVISVGNFVLCVGVALVIGLYLSFIYMYKNRYTRSFVITLALLPAVVCVVIMMVNGNVGAGVAVAGSFSLVRFRSVPGTAKDICMIFLSMGAGLIVGMGYIGYGILFTLVLGFIFFLYQAIGFGKKKNGISEKTLHVTIPEDLDYTHIFDDLFEKYTKEVERVSVKTTNMGSLFKLTYNIVLKDYKEEKTLIDQLRCRNGNLEIVVSRQETGAYEL